MSHVWQIRSQDFVQICGEQIHLQKKLSRIWCGNLTKPVRSAIGRGLSVAAAHKPKSLRPSSIISNHFLTHFVKQFSNNILNGASNGQFVSTLPQVNLVWLYGKFEFPFKISWTGVLFMPSSDPIPLSIADYRLCMISSPE